MRHINPDDQHEFSMDSGREFNMDHSIIIIIIFHSMGSLFATNNIVRLFYVVRFFWLVDRNMNTQEHHNFRF